MANVIHYKLNATEWALLIQTKSKEEIKAAYLAQRDKSDRADRNKDHTEIHRMISEHFRMFLSNFVKDCNTYLERKGSVVMKRFDKYPISTEMSYQEEFDRICDLKLCSYQQLKQKYQPDEKLYDQENLLAEEDGIPSLLRSSIGLYRGKVKFEILPIAIELVRPNSDVLRKILQKEKINKNPEKPPPKNK